MRSDAVLRVILNVPLFPGMQCDLEQEKFLRLVALEDGALVHLAIKLANATDAQTLLTHLHEHIPPKATP